MVALAVRHSEAAQLAELELGLDVLGHAKEDVRPSGERDLDQHATGAFELISGHVLTQEAGMRRVRTKLLSNGAAVVTWAVKSTPVIEATEPEEAA